LAGTGLWRMWDSVRLTVLLHRFEIAAVAAGSIILTVASVVIAFRLGGLAVPIACFGEPDVHGATGSIEPACRAAYAAFAEMNDREAERVFAVLAGFPVIAGMLLGIPLVSREIEQGTAVLPWVLGGQRRRWLLRRVAIMGVILAGLMVPLALAADALEGIRNPLVDASRSFASEGLRGPVLVARATAGFGVAVLLGALVGRQLPAVILGLVASLVIVVAALAVMDAWGQSSAIYVPSDSARLGDRSILAAYRRKDGTIVSVRDIAALQPPRPSLRPGAVDDQWIAANFDEVLLVIPGSRYGEEAAIHSALLVLAGLIGVGGAAVVVDRRRPS
jgi:hypothetical protein